MGRLLEHRTQPTESYLFLKRHPALQSYKLLVPLTAFTTPEWYFYWTKETCAQHYIYSSMNLDQPVSLFYGRDTV